MAAKSLNIGSRRTNPAGFSGSSSQGFRIEGFDDVYKTLNRLSDKELRKVARGMPNAAAAMLRKEIRDEAPKVSGNLSKAIKNRPASGEGNDFVAHVYVETGKRAQNDGWYWRLVEFGTAAHEIKRRLKKGLNIGGGVFRGSAQHPGKAAQPFIRPTIDRNKARIPGAMADYARKRWDKAVKKARR
ncbi:MAG: hypothetical protein CMN85_10860 [Spongiibacteraceae bacterium]|uniref:HK97-gp10 family putative phage morphogenesis protein n=1 Tax=uncultured Haliea sp. TaxID=622616 RepID=UPI000C4153AB|nr:hypothetical protein [Spongiibacteraceae bacterium]|tara:strand:+ start:23552 stop:24109 length:558 start_codon:yes stop_codon:yes gene_type:complete